MNQFFFFFFKLCTEDIVTVFIHNMEFLWIVAKKLLSQVRPEFIY